MKQIMRYGIVSLLSLLLLACAAPAELATVEAPPPELTTLPLPEAELPEVEADSAAEAAISAQVRTELKQPARPRAFLPGLSARSSQRGAKGSAGADPAEGDSAGGDSARGDSAEATENAETVPFEIELLEQRKRIQLGLDPEQQEQNPVDNVINLGF